MALSLAAQTYSNLDEICLDEIEEVLNKTYVLESVVATRLGFDASGKGVRTSRRARMRGKLFEMTHEYGPYAGGGSLHRADNTTFAKTTEKSWVETQWYLVRAHTLIEIDRHMADLMESREVTKDHLSSLTRYMEWMIESQTVLAREFAWKGGNGVLVKATTCASSSGADYWYFTITLDTTDDDRPTQWTLPGMVIDIYDYTTATTLNSPTNGLVVMEQLSDTQIKCIKYNTADAHTNLNTLNGSVTDPVKRNVSQETTNDGWKRKTSPWSLPDIIATSDPTAQVATVAQYVGAQTRDTYPVLKAQVEYGTADGTEEPFTVNRARNLLRKCHRGGSTINAIYCCAEVEAEIAAQQGGMGRVDWIQVLRENRAQIGNVNVEQIKLDGKLIDVIIDDFAPAHKAFFLAEKEWVHKMARPGWHFIRQGGALWKHLYPDRDNYAMLYVGDIETACSNPHGQGLMKDIKYTVE